jgi:23S rRNA G2445 N2-methylase RlmL
MNAGNWSSRAINRLTDNGALSKKIKKNIYGKLQTIKVIFPSGFADVALDTINHILNNLWLPQTSHSEITLIGNEIYIRNIHMFSVIELLLRSQCLTDIRLVIFQGKTFNKFAFEKKCQSMPWDYYLNKSMALKIKVTSIASNAFHETALKKILTEIISPYTLEVASADELNETTCLYADLYKNKLTLSISLAGEALYKKGYRGILSASAPLREDAAAACIIKALQFGKQNNINYVPETVLIPFSGTGTFAFEFLQNYFNVSPALFQRQYVIEKMPLFRAENFNYLLKKAIKNCLLPNVEHADRTPEVLCIDNSKNANHACTNNIENFNHLLEMSKLYCIKPKLLDVDFFAMDFSAIEFALEHDVFIMLNPPYGLRLNKNANTDQLYHNIAKKILELSTITKSKILGFILCPTESAWSVFIKILKHAKTQTYHFNQGGMDIRVCQFYI